MLQHSIVHSTKETMKVLFPTTMRLLCEKGNKELPSKCEVKEVNVKLGT